MAADCTSDGARSAEASRSPPTATLEDEASAERETSAGPELSDPAERSANRHATPAETAISTIAAAASCGSVNETRRVAPRALELGTTEDTEDVGDSMRSAIPAQR